MSTLHRAVIRTRMAKVRYAKPRAQTWTKKRLPPTYARECARRLRQLELGLLSFGPRT